VTPGKSNKAIYAGSFDPFTNGHLDICRRAKSIFPELIVAVANNPRKKGLFSPEERVELAQSSLAASQIEAKVQSFDGLLVDLCHAEGAKVIIRGLRAVSDYEYESQLAITNRQLSEEIETVFLMTSTDCSFISSSMVKEIASFGGEVGDFVPPIVIENLKTKFKF